jgi:acyl CoA:acetate/3-ketoacid CoA transferase alpha subunit
MDFNTFLELIDEKFALSLEHGKGKILPLEEAIKEYVKPNQIIHLGFCGGFSMGAIQEITRQFYDKNPNFHVACLGATTHVQYMLGANLQTPMIKKLTTSYAGDAYPRSTMVPIFNHHIKKGMDIEYCTVLTFTLMLLAAAMDLPWLPTNSIIDSGMEEEGYFKKIEDPFATDSSSPDQEIGLIKSLHPDVSIYHAWASDPYGNAVFVPPYGGDIYGAYACNGPVIVTTERIVDTDYIRRHRDYVRLPGHIVAAVVELSYGSHPSMFYGLDGGGYVEDIPYLLNFHKNNRVPEKLHGFVKEWILNVRDFQEYKKKVGVEKLLELSGRIDPESWKEDLKCQLENVDDLDSRPINEFERLVLMASEVITEILKERNYEIILAGQGFSNLAAWMALFNLSEDDVPLDLVAEVGFYGYVPRPGSPFVFNISNIPTCKMATNVIDILGINLGRSNSCAVLGAAQLDRFGNINSSKIGIHHLIGSGGSNDVGSQYRAREIFVVMVHGKDRLLDKVPYVTVPGERVSTVITTKGVLRKIDNSNELVLTEYFDPDKRLKQDIINDIKENTGWDLKVARDVKRMSISSEEKVNMLRLLDPNGFFLTHN